MNIPLKKLNLGAGENKKEDYINLDWNNLTEPDVPHNLNTFPYPFNDDTFDLIEAFHILEHLDKPNLALKELYRVTKKYCILSVPNEPIWRILNLLRGAYVRDLGNTEGHINHWSTSSFQKLVSSYFRIVKLATPLPWTILLCLP